MDEENKEKTEEVSKDKTDTTPTEDDGVKKTVETLDRADEIVSRRERVAAREEALQERKEALEARKAVSGETEAGQPQEKKAEISDKEYAEKAMSGDLNAKQK